MDARGLRRIARIVASLGGVVLTGEICRHVHHINQTAVAVALLFVLELIAINIGFVEALVSTAAAGAELGYFFARLPSRPPERMVEWVAITTFIVVALITIRLSDQARSATIEAAKRAEEMSLLCKFGLEILPAENGTTMIERGLSAAVNIFAIEGVALRLSTTGAIFRAGPAGPMIPDGELGVVNIEKRAAESRSGDFNFVSLQGRDGPLGTLGFCGAKISPEVLRIICHRLAMSLERAFALERATEVEAARRSAELGSAVLDSLAHDIKTPLATTKVALDSLFSIKDELPDTHAPFLSMMKEELDRMDQVVGEVLHMGRLERGLFSVSREPHSVEALIFSTLEEMGGTLKGRSVGIDIPEHIPPIFADLRLLKEVLKQLLENAIKYTPDGMPLLISSSESDGMVMIEVADHGPGIPEVDRHRIFDKYYRGQDSEDKTVGLGLGLAIAKKIVKAHGGQIWVSPNHGGGSVFHLSVPSPQLVAP
jgi:two-component system, OmpR family, sensor histidine kinase KdpD